MWHLSNKLFACTAHVVLDFGAAGDGSKDNTAPFQTALNAAKAGGIGKRST